jgi:hypothetical protein
MKKILILVGLFVAGSANAWIYPGGFGPGFYGGFGYGYGMGYGMGYMYPPLQVPSFNYTTVIQQSPPIIIEQRQPEVIYRDREVCNSECERLRGYFGKR